MSSKNKELATAVITIVAVFLFIIFSMHVLVSEEARHTRLKNEVCEQWMPDAEYFNHGTYETCEWYDYHEDARLVRRFSSVREETKGK